MATRRRITRPETVRGGIYRLKIVLRGTKPPIWRRVLVPADFTLAQLHVLIQVVFDWQDCHLHQFHAGGRRVATGRERVALVADILGGAGTRATYIYDLGDDWEHVIVMEAAEPAEVEVAYPRCIGGKRGAPPEDCGGVFGFYNLLAAMADPGHPDHAELLEWAGSYDPGAFSADAVTQRLQQLFRARGAAAH